MSATGDYKRGRAAEKKSAAKKIKKLEAEIRTLKALLAMERL